MQFYEWETLWALYVKHARRNGLPLEAKNYLDYYRWQSESALVDTERAANISVCAEMLWLAERAPYYNVHPALVPKLTHIDLEKIPVCLVEVPCGFTVVNVRFAQQHDELTMKDALVPNKEKIITNFGQNITPKRGDFVHSILMIKPIPELLKFANITSESNSCKLICLTQFGACPDDLAISPYSIAGLFSLSPEYSIADALRDAAAHANLQYSDSYMTIKANCMRIACTIGFMANSKSEFITPDVLNKDRFKFERGDDQQRDKLIKKAHRRGKVGWNIGNDLKFLGSVGFVIEGGQSETDKQLKYSHIRGGHFHAVRYGPNKSKVKIMWYRPVQVRADLPFK